MTLVKDRHLGRYSHYDGAVVEPSTLGSAEVLPNGQVVPVTDQSGVNLMVRKDGMLVPAIDILGVDGSALQTAGDMVIQLDWATGTSPPEGTHVVNQAQVDAIGTVKYLSDVFRIVPSLIGHFIEVQVAAGIHYRDPLVTLFGGMHASIVPLRLTSDAAYRFEVTKKWYMPSIQIYGEYSTYDSNIAGTSMYSATETKFTRDTGTWVANDLRDKTISIVSGAGAGTRLKIYSNTETEIIIGGKLTAGTCVVDIIEHASIFDAKDGPAGSAATRFMSCLGVRYNASANVIYADIQIGDSTNPLFISGTGQSLHFWDCTHYGGSQFNQGYFTFQRCLVETPSNALWQGIDIIRHSYATVTSCIIRVHKSEAGIALLSAYTVSVLWVNSTILDVAGSTGFTASALLISRGALIDFGDFCRVLGNGANTGIIADGDGTTNILDDAHQVYLNDCAVGLQVSEGNLNISGLVADNVDTLFKLSSRASLKVGTSLTLSNITMYANIDGVDFDDTYFTNRGDSVEGQYGSILERG